MIESAHWIIAIAATVLVGVVGTLYFRLVVMRRDEMAAGLAALAGLSWREFMHLVLDALGRRGYSRVFNREAPSGDDDVALERDGRRFLLSCKHGSAFVIGSTHVAELSNDIRLANATGGILATQGRIAAEARAPAALQRIELLDGATLWPELRELIDPAQRAVILEGAQRKAGQRTLLSWVLAVVVGAAMFLLLPGAAPSASGQDASATAAARAAAAEAGLHGPAPADAAALPAGPVPAPAPGDEAALEQQRQAVADAVSTLPMVDRAVWSTHSTLQVYLLDTKDDAIPRICPLLEHYEALASSRLQLTPPPGSSAQTRFRQCRSY
ncbi:MAG TPA: restriction endonuclease [Luteimonas sp.]|nr:restriction endonuclease [Luteimonas sp.]